MAKKQKSTKRATGPACPICSDRMKLKSVIPAAHIFPELRTFQCAGCGNLRTDEVELVPEIQRAA